MGLFFFGIRVISIEKDFIRAIYNNAVRRKVDLSEIFHTNTIKYFYKLPT